MSQPALKRLPNISSPLLCECVYVGFLCTLAHHGISYSAHTTQQQVRYMMGVKSSHTDYSDLLQ